MSSKSKVEEISTGEYDEPEVEERLEDLDLDTSRVPPDASAVMAIDDDFQRPTPPDSEIYERRESRPDEEFHKRLLAKAAMAADLKAETKRPTFMEDDSSQSQPTLSDYETYESRPDNEFNKRLLAKAAMAVDSKEENTRPPVIDVDSQSKPFDSTNVVDEASKKSSLAPQPQPPTQDVIKQIEEGNDAALRPFNSSELEDESKPKIGLRKRMESTDEEVGQLPKIHNYHQYLRSETQTQKTAACSASVDDNEAAFFQQMNDAEKYMSVGPVVEAYLVEDEGGKSGGVDHITVYEATPLEPELPWWKQRRSKVFMVINCVLIAALAIGLGVSFSLSRHDNTATTTQLAENHDESSSSDESSLVRSSGSSSSSSSKDA
eukprot:scaffold10278_cov113-Skeletonema_dohrnii-CCMP3373.AAC.1